MTVPAGARPAAPPSLPARRADAVAAHRTERTARRRMSAAGPRADVATVLDLARLACLDELAADLGRLSARVTARIEQARPAELAALPESLAADLAEVGARLDRTVVAHTAPDLRRLAARSCPGAALLPVPGPDRPAAEVLRAAVAPVTGTASVDPRLFGALAGLPVLAVHGIGAGSALVAAGVVVLAGCLARARTVAAGRARAREHLARSVAAAGTAGERELRRRLIGVETAVVAALERALGDRAGHEVRGAAV